MGPIFINQFWLLCTQAVWQWLNVFNSPGEWLGTMWSKLNMTFLPPIWCEVCIKQNKVINWKQPGIIVFIPFCKFNGATISIQYSLVSQIYCVMCNYVAINSKSITSVYMFLNSGFGCKNSSKMTAFRPKMIKVLLC